MSCSLRPYKSLLYCPMSWDTGRNNRNVYIYMMDLSPPLQHSSRQSEERAALERRRLWLAAPGRSPCRRRAVTLLPAGNLARRCGRASRAPARPARGRPAGDVAGGLGRLGAVGSRGGARLGGVFAGWAPRLPARAAVWVAGGRAGQHSGGGGRGGPRGSGCTRLRHPAPGWQPSCGCWRLRSLGCCPARPAAAPRPMMGLTCGPYLAGVHCRSRPTSLGRRSCQVRPLQGSFRRGQALPEWRTGRWAGDCSGTERGFP